MADVLIDTDVVSLLLKKREPDWIGAELINATVWLTFVTIGELASGRRSAAGARRPGGASIPGLPAARWSPTTVRSPSSGAGSPVAPSAEAARGRRTTPGLPLAACGTASRS